MLVINMPAQLINQHSVMKTKHIKRKGLLPNLSIFSVRLLNRDIGTNIAGHNNVGAAQGISRIIQHTKIL